MSEQGMIHVAESRWRGAMTADLRWRYVVAVPACPVEFAGDQAISCDAAMEDGHDCRGRPAHLLAGPVPFLRDGRHVLALTGHTATVGSVSASRAESLLPAEFCAWLWEWLSERAPCPLGDKCQRDATFTGHSGLGQLNCTVCKSEGWVRVLRVPCPVCAILDGSRKLTADLDANGIPVPSHLRPRDGGCGLDPCRDGLLALTGIRPAFESERPVCGWCGGLRRIHRPDLSGTDYQATDRCSDCAGTGREPGMWIVGELP